jgi:hypothetical protein
MNGALSVKRRHNCRRHLERARYSGNSHTREHEKTMLRILGTTALLMIGGEVPAFAQAAGNTGTRRVRLFTPLMLMC